MIIIYRLSNLLVCSVALLFSLSAFAQTRNLGGVDVEDVIEKPPVVHSRELNIGDRVPNIQFTMFNYPAKTASLSDFKGKWVILDFWATWCSSCIYTMPKMDSLQKKFKASLQVLLVNSIFTGDDEAKIEAFFKKRRMKDGRQFELAATIKDTLTDALFPHRGIPHYAIISPEGILTSITSSDQITDKNIQGLINNEAVTFKRKKDIFFDHRELLFLTDDISMQKISQYSFFVKGIIAGLGKGIQFRKQGHTLRGIAIRNQPILSMYLSVVRDFFPSISYNRVLLEVADSSKIVFDPKKGNKESWDEENSFTYERIVPVEEAKNLYRTMLQDLNQFSDFWGRIEKRKVSCLILVKGEAASSLLGTKGEKYQNRLYGSENAYLRNAPISDLVSRLNKVESLGAIFLDETHYIGNIDILFKKGIGNLQSLKEDLARYGLQLVTAEREIDMFVLSDKEKNEKLLNH